MGLGDVAGPTAPTLFPAFKGENPTHVPRGGTGLMSTVTSSKRVEANRKNAARSPGPRSATGKCRSRFNAVKHGMAAKLPVLPGEDPDAFRAHRDAWTAELQPRGQVEHSSSNAPCVSPGSSSGSTAPRPPGWPPRPRPPARLAADQSDEVLALGRRLFWDPLGPLPLYPHLGNSIGRLFTRFSWSNEIDDPNEPARVVNRLESTAIGCAWLLDRWGELRVRLEDGWTLQPPERFKAIRLLGRQPMDAPQDDRVMMIYLACWAMDPGGPHGFQDLVNELHPAELKLWIDRLDDREAMDRRPADRPSGQAELLKIVAEEEERLEEVLELHLERDEAVGLEPLLFDDSDSGERLRRYQLACNRTLLRILDTLERRQRARGKARAVPAAAAADRPADIVPPPAAASTPRTSPVHRSRRIACRRSTSSTSSMMNRPSSMVSRPSSMVSRPSSMASRPSSMMSRPSSTASRPMRPPPRPQARRMSARLPRRSPLRSSRPARRPARNFRDFRGKPRSRVENRRTNPTSRPGPRAAGRWTAWRRCWPCSSWPSWSSSRRPRR